MPDPWVGVLLWDFFRFWNPAFLIVEYKILHAYWWYDIISIAIAPMEAIVDP